MTFFIIIFIEIEIPVMCIDRFRKNMLCKVFGR